MIGNKLRQRRIELGLTQEELAYMVGYTSKSTINKIEKNKHDVNHSTIEKLAEALKCSPAFFIEDVNHEPRPSDAVMEYAEKLSKLPPDMQDNVMQYIDFLSRKSE